MSEQTAAELFADDLIKIVMGRLSVRLQPAYSGGGAIEVLLVDNQTGYAVMCSGPRLQLPEVVVKPMILEFNAPTQSTIERQSG